MDIDLNLNNYSMDDLKRLFGLSSSFSILEVEQQKQILLERLIQFNVNPQMQNEILLFLNSAKDTLINQMNIIPKPDTPFVYSNPSNFFQGTINPLEKRLITKTVCIDTLFRSNYIATKSTDFTYTFPETINNVVSMKIKAIEIPTSWYTVSEEKKNNKFLIIYSTNQVYEFVIPDGIYDYASGGTIVDIINTQLIDKTLQLRCRLKSYKVEFYWPVGEDSTTFTLDFTNYGRMITCKSTEGVSLGWILGFKEDIYTGETYYLSESFYNPLINTYFFVDVDDFHNNHSTDSVISAVRTHNGVLSYLGNNIMARIPFSNYSNSIGLGVSSEFYVLNKREYFGPVRLERMTIRLLDRFGKVIDLNGTDYSIVFEIIQLYS